MRENGEIYTAGKSFTLDRMVIFAKSLSKFIFFWETTFRVSSSGEWLSQEMAKSTFGLTLSARLIDLPAGKGVPLHYELPATDGEIKVL